MHPVFRHHSCPTSKTDRGSLTNPCEQCWKELSVTFNQDATLFRSESADFFSTMESIHHNDQNAVHDVHVDIQEHFSQNTQGQARVDLVAFDPIVSQLT
jgi:hypothetical protein